MDEFFFVGPAKIVLPRAPQIVGTALSERMGIINSEEARHSRVDWEMNVIMILSYYDLTGDTIRFILERLEHIIML